MKKRNILIVLGTIVLVILPIAIYSLFSGGKERPLQNDQFAQCLTERGAKMYGAFWCSHCLSQKEMFGKSFEKVDYTECSTPDGIGQKEACQEAKVNGYPTWEFADGTRLEGEVSLESLAEKTGCTLTQ